MFVELEASEVPHALEFESSCSQSVALSHNGLVPAEPHSALHGVHMAGDPAAKQVKHSKPIWRLPCFDKED
jgi:hypothetical protein